MKHVYILFLFLSLSLAAQVEPLWKYGNDINEEPVTYKIRGEKYYHYDNYITNGKDTIFKSVTDSITYYTLLKKRYLFVSYYPKEQQGIAIGFAGRKLYTLDIVDLKKPYRKWHYDFTALEDERDLKVGLDQIIDFIPKSGEIIFDIKFSFDKNSELKPLPNTKKDIPSY